MPTIAIGTEKGAWFLTPKKAAPGGWRVVAPQLAGWRVTAFGTAPDGRRLAATASNWFGVGLHASRDLDEWQQVGAPTWTEQEAADGRSMEAVWTLATVGDTVFAGVADAGLFRSQDLATWTGMPAINDHPDRPQWMPGLGGMCAHHVLSDGGDRLWVGISSVGVFASEDGGLTVERRDTGVPPTATAAEGAPADGWCVHGLAHDPEEPDRLWRQEHRGVFRTVDGGRSWEEVGDGLPTATGFGFPMLRDHATGRLFVVPQHSDGRRLPVEGRFAVWASDDDGDSWCEAGTGWPIAPTFTAVMRNAMATDHDGLVVAGTTAGQVWLSTDHGHAWSQLPSTFPRIGAVEIWGS